MLRPVRALALGAFALAGCQVVLNLDDKVYVDASADATRLDPEVGTTADGGVDDDASVIADAQPITCPTNTKGGPMVLVGNGAVCIDATEVTRDQYAAFLAATNNGVDVGGQPPQCAWNTSYR